MLRGLGAPDETAIDTESGIGNNHGSLRRSVCEMSLIQSETALRCLGRKPSRLTPALLTSDAVRFLFALSETMNRAMQTGLDTGG